MTQNVRKYTFMCEDYDTETGLTTSTVKEFETMNDAWSGYDGPMYEFFNFLKGCGYAFGINDDIGVLSEDFGFRPANNEY